MYKIMVCSSSPRKGIDQENNMDTRVAQFIDVWNNKAGSV